MSGGQRKGERQRGPEQIPYHSMPDHFSQCSLEGGQGKEGTKAWRNSLVRVQKAITLGKDLDPKSLHHLSNAMLQRAGPNDTW